MKTVLLTGGNRGFGAILNDEFVENKYWVYAFNSHVADLSTSKGVSMVAEYMGRVGPDVFISNAGLKRGSAHDMWWVNCYAPEILINTAINKRIPLIINISSTAIFTHDDLYSETKLALKRRINTLKDDAIKSGVRIMDVIPGAMKCGMAKGREDFNELIDPYESAKFIVELCELPKSFYVREIHLQRTYETIGKIETSKT